MISYKIDVLDALKNAGYSTYKIRKNKIFGERELQNFRQNIVVYNQCLDRLCCLLHCQPGDLLQYTPDEIPSADSGAEE